jgi:hypothetical protein
MSGQINGTTLLVPIVETNNNLKLYYANLPSSTFTLISLPPGVTSFSIFSLSDDGTTMVVVGNNGQLFYTTLQSSTFTLIDFPSVEVTSFSNILLSNDGTKLVVVGNNGQLFYTILPSSTLTLINFPSVEVTSFSTILLSHDGTKLVVVGNNGQLFYTTLPSTTLTLIDFPSVEVTSFSTILLSRDGTTIVVVDNNKNFYYTILPSSILTIISYMSNQQPFFLNIFLLSDNGTILVAKTDFFLSYANPLSTGLSFISLPQYGDSFQSSIMESAKMSNDGTSIVAYNAAINTLFYITSISISPYSTLIPISFPSGISPSGSFLLNNNGTILVAQGNDSLLYYTTSLSSSALTPITLPLDANTFIGYSLSYDGTYLLAIDDNNQYYYTNLLSSSELTLISFPTIANICFPAGTPVLTDQGLIAIDEINTDMHTINRKRIVDITKTISKETFLVCFEKDALGTNSPTQKTIISHGHQIMYEGVMHQAKWFIEKFPGVKAIPYTGEPLYNVLLENHDVMIVNNLICETLQPENPIAKFYTKQCKLSKENRDIMIKVLQCCLDRNDVDAYAKIMQCC